MATLRKTPAQVARKPQYRAQLLSCVPTARAVDGKEAQFALLFA